MYTEKCIDTLFVQAEEIGRLRAALNFVGVMIKSKVSQERILNFIANRCDKSGKEVVKCLS
jgi:hypothetical protein